MKEGGSREAKEDAVIVSSCSLASLTRFVIVMGFLNETLVFWFYRKTEKKKRAVKKVFKDPSGQLMYSELHNCTVDE